MAPEIHLLIFILCVGVFRLNLCLWTHVHALPSEAIRDCWIPWDGTYKGL